MTKLFKILTDKLKSFGRKQFKNEFSDVIKSSAVAYFLFFNVNASASFNIRAFRLLWFFNFSDLRIVSYVS